MGFSRSLLLIFVVTSVCECSESAELECEEYSHKTYHLLAGEAFSYVDDLLREEDAELELTWSRNSPDVELVSSDEQEHIHYHGHTLFFLNLRPEDSGTYTARLMESGMCSDFSVTVEVLDASDRMNPNLLFGASEKPGNVICPLPVQNTCKTLRGNYTWYKDYKLLPGLDEAEIWIKKKDQGVFTCMCTWKHNDRTYNSSGSRRLVYNEPSAHQVQILSPLNGSEQFAEPGAEVTLKCTVNCGINVERDCHVHWSVNGVPADQKEGYNQTTQQVMEEPTKKTLTTNTLVIRRVSQEDFQTFECRAEGEFKIVFATLTLKQQASIIPFAIAATCVLLFCVLAIVLVKCFAIELALCFRPYLPLWGHEKDVRLYDAYVVYHTHNLDKSTEDTLVHFVTQTLPSVLEEKCGYRLFIQGRDELPGQDNAELVESSMEQSRRLMVILTPGSGARSESGSEVSEPSPASLTDSVIGGFDWQIGLHHVLLQMEMSVILIQLGDTGPQGYSRLPIGLQHLIRKSAPIRWPERSAALYKLRFWNRVRYLMPARPARTYPRSALV